MLTKLVIGNKKITINKILKKSYRLDFQNILQRIT